MDLHTMLKELVDYGGSDLYLIAGAVPCMSIQGQMRAPAEAKGQRLVPLINERFARQILRSEQWEELIEKRELNVAYVAPSIGRFRVNVLWQRGSVGMVMRRVVDTIPTLRQLGLPPVLRTIALADRGIVIVSGATGSGKSTTLAAMINYRNHLRNGHIVTVEDPIEFVYRHERSIITQREVGIDTLSFEEALKNCLRQAPSVISIGEMRDADTVKFALHAAETGHLVFATLHSTNTVQTFERILHFYPAPMHEQVLAQMALNTRAVISQRLVKRVGGGRVCAAEILVNTSTVQEFIHRGDMNAIRETLKMENDEGMQAFDLVLYKLFKKGYISRDEALSNADSANDLELKMRGIGVEENTAWTDMSDPWGEIQSDFDWPASLPRPDDKEEGEEQQAVYTNRDAQVVPVDDVASPNHTPFVVTNSGVNIPATPPAGPVKAKPAPKPAVPPAASPKDLSSAPATRHGEEAPRREPPAPTPPPPKPEPEPEPEPKPRPEPEPKDEDAKSPGPWPTPRPGSITERYRDVIESAASQRQSRDSVSTSSMVYSPGTPPPPHEPDERPRRSTPIPEPPMPAQPRKTSPPGTSGPPPKPPLPDVDDDLDLD